MSTPEPLRIEVAPDIVETLGLNLYTDLARVLVEFVANAYDADSPWVDIRLDAEKIRQARSDLREASKEQGTAHLLDEQTLPEDIVITVEDRGHGMTREDLQSKFLRIGRKRRKLDPTGGRSPKKRLVMGRKGIGKLAGFGVARRVEVTTRPEGQSHALRITLDYEKLIGHETTASIEVEESKVDGGARLVPSGTRIVLSHLSFAPSSAREETISQQISKHFGIVKPEEFEIRLNGVAVGPYSRKYAFAFPEPDLAILELVDTHLDVDGRQIPFRYRIRFTPPEQQLNATERGVRIYARQRLAAVPSLLDLKTGIHGFQNTHYLDGEVHADFIDDQPTDFIASDRQDLRWDTPVLAELRSFLTDMMEKACVAYQATKERTLAERVRLDDFTKRTVQEADLPVHRREVAYRIAAKLAAGSPAETKDEYYRSTLPIVVRGLGYGELMSAIRDIARADHPSFPDLVKALAALTAVEWDDYNKVISGRLHGIEALRRLCSSVSFRDANNEDELHALLQKNPWLIEPTFWAFLTSNVTERTLSQRLSQELGVGTSVPPDYDKSASEEVTRFASNRRPDLTFLLSNYALRRVVVVELKAPNTPLHVGHLHQLEGYMRRCEEFLRAKHPGASLRVEGLLIGSRAMESESSKEMVRELRWREEKKSPADAWRVFDISELLRLAEDAHRELLDAYDRAREATTPTSI